MRHSVSLIIIQVVLCVSLAHFTLNSRVGSNNVNNFLTLQKKIEVVNAEAKNDD